MINIMGDEVDTMNKTTKYMMSVLVCMIALLTLGAAYVFAAEEYTYETVLRRDTIFFDDVSLTTYMRLDDMGNDGYQADTVPDGVYTGNFQVLVEAPAEYTAYADWITIFEDVNISVSNGYARYTFPRDVFEACYDAMPSIKDNLSDVTKLADERSYFRIHSRLEIVNEEEKTICDFTGINMSLICDPNKAETFEERYDVDYYTGDITLSASGRMQEAKLGDRYYTTFLGLAESPDVTIAWPVSIEAYSVITGDKIGEASVAKKDVEKTPFGSYSWKTTYEFTKNMSPEEPYFVLAEDGNGIKTKGYITFFYPNSENTDPPAPSPAVKVPALSKDTLSLLKGKSTTLKVKNKPKGSKVTWTSMDMDVAAVSRTGKVVPKKTGITTIRAIITKGEEELAYLDCSVTVEKPSVSANSISLTMEVNETATAELINTLDGSDPVTGWRSTKRSVAEVDPDTGVITAKKAGKTYICVKRNTRTYKIKVMVYDPVIKAKKSKLKVGRKMGLTISKGDRNGTFWDTSDPMIAEIDPTTGKLKGIAPGTVTVYATNAGKTVAREFEIIE